MNSKKILCISMLLVACSSTSRAQVGPDGIWKFPTSAREYCLNVEQGLVAQYKALVEANRKTIDGGNEENRRQLLQLAESHKAALGFKTMNFCNGGLVCRRENSGQKLASDRYLRFSALAE